MRFFHRTRPLRSDVLQGNDLNAEAAVADRSFSDGRAARLRALRRGAPPRRDDHDRQVGVAYDTLRNAPLVRRAMTGEAVPAGDDEVRPFAYGSIDDRTRDVAYRGLPARLCLETQAARALGSAAGDRPRRLRRTVERLAARGNRPRNRPAQPGEPESIEDPRLRDAQNPRPCSREPGCGDLDRGVRVGGPVVCDEQRQRTVIVDTRHAWKHPALPAARSLSDRVAVTGPWSVPGLSPGQCRAGTTEEI